MSEKQNTDDYLQQLMQGIFSIMVTYITLFSKSVVQQLKYKLQYQLVEDLSHWCRQRSIMLSY